MQRRLATATVLTVVLALTASAQQKLTLDQAIEIGLQNSKKIHASTMSVQYAEAKADEAYAAKLPQLKLTGAYTRLSELDPFVITMPPPISMSFTMVPSIVNTYTTKFSLVQPVFTGGKLSNAIEAADFAAKAAAQDLNKDKSDFVYSLKSAYWSLFKAQEFKKVIDQTVEQVQARMKDLQNMNAQGMATQNDVLKLQVQLSDVRVRQIDANNNVQLAALNLKSVMGLPLDTDIELNPSVESATGDIGGLAPLMAKAFERQPALKAMDLKVKAGEAGVSSARGGWFPQVSLAANYNYARPNQRVQPTKDRFDGTWDVSIGVSFDIWNWGQTASQTTQAEASLEQAKDARSLLRDAVTLEVTQSYLNVKQARERIDVAGQGVTQADENYRTTSQKFKEGMALTSDLLDAQVALLQAKTNYTQSLVDYQLAEARLQRAIGD